MEFSPSRGSLSMYERHHINRVRKCMVYIALQRYLSGAIVVLYLVASIAML